MCIVYLRFIGKRVVNFLFLLHEPFARYYGWGATSQYRLKIGVCLNGVSLAQNIRYKGSSSTSHSSCRKTWLNVLSDGIRMWAQVSFVFSQFTHLWNRHTDGRTERPSKYRALHYMQSHGKYWLPTCISGNRINWFVCAYTVQSR